MKLILTNHWAGFFSCNCMRLAQIINFCNLNKEDPDEIINNNMYTWYNSNTNIDICKDFFITNNEIDVNYEYIEKAPNVPNVCMQFMNYKELELTEIYKYVNKFFSPSQKILDIKQKIIEKYSVDINNSCVLFCRSNDKATETRIPTYDEYTVEADKIVKINPNIKFIIQSDECEFIDYMKNKYPNNIIFYDEIRIINKNTSMTVDNHGRTPDNNYKYMLNFLAIVLIMSECKYVICNKGNISLWILFFRQHLENFNYLQ